MINLRSLELHNFLSHVDTNISLDAHKGLVLIEGITTDGHYSSNGSGKSSILEGIVYALTGDTLRGVGVNDVINRNSKKNTQVALSFTKDSTDYLINRYRKDDKFGDSLVLHKGEEDISKRVNKETQNSLNDILNISYKILVSTILLGEGLSSRFTQLSDPEKKSLIESTLNLSYDMNSIRAKANSELSALKLEKASITGQLAAFKEVQSIDVENMRDRLPKEKEKLATYEEELKLLNNSLPRIQGEIEESERKGKVLYNSMLSYTNLENNLHKLDEDTLKYIDEIKKIQSTETPVCNVCHQHLATQESISSFVNSYKDKISDIEEQKNKVREELSTLPDYNLLTAKYDEINKGLLEKKTSLQNLLSRVTAKNAEISQSDSLVRSIEFDLSRYESSLSNITSLEEKSESIDKDIAKYDYFYKLFSPTGIIVNILGESIEYINKRLTAYSEILLEKRYRLNFVKGKISLVDSEGASYQSLSNGEKRRLDIAIQFSLHDYVHVYCGMKLDCCFIDEILDTLDDIGVDNIFDVLRLKLDYCDLKSIYVITHNNKLKSKFDDVITVRKGIDGNSHLE